MKNLGLIVVLLLAGCPHPPPPTPIPTPDAQLDAAPQPVMVDAAIPAVPSCPASVTQAPEDVCDSLFTADNHACVVCTGGGGCIDHSVEVYCTKGACALDPACHRVSDPSTGGGAAGRIKAARPIPACPAAVSETPEGVCAARFTKDNHACVRCKGGKGCLDHKTEVYCITTPTCAADPACHHVAGK
jgi:hypothetical protein